ncbi:hypothetical protein M405DRAFT_815301, partial [Rhizopogon salebrosus TDB-379]
MLSIQHLPQKLPELVLSRTSATTACKDSHMTGHLINMIDLLPIVPHQEIGGTGKISSETDVFIAGM